MTEEICSDYSRQVIEGICHCCKQKKIDCIICNVHHPKFKDGIFEYQFWAGSGLLKVQDVDVILVLSGIYFSSYSVEEFVEMLKPFSGKKIISLSQSLPIENSFSILSDNVSIFDKLFDFLLTNCGSKRIAFISANKTTSIESQLRFNAYKKNLQKNKIPYDESIVFHALFTMNSAYDELEERLGKDCTSVDFDTLIAANDQMALGAMAFLKDHGIKVPEQVKVIGYDDIDEAAAVKPSLTSINPFNFNLGFNGAMTAYMVANGIDVQKEFISPAKLVIRNSTGYEFCENKKALETNSLNQLILRGYDNTYIYYLLDTVQCNDTIDIFLKRIEKSLKEVDIKKFALVFYDKPIFYKRFTEFVMPEKAKLEYIYENESGRIIEDEYFSPKEHVIPSYVFEDSCENYISQVIFYGEKQYGYMIYSVGERDLIFYNLYAKALSNAIANSYEYTKQYLKNLNLQMEKYELEQTSRTDELTGVLNRRGFDIQGQQQIDYAIASGATGVVFYGDMNGLKKINDTFGHEYGDKAIKAEAEILRKTFRSTDVVGRIGGDEFAIVAAGFPLRKLSATKDRIELLCVEMKEKYKLPFELSISLGAIEFDSKLCDLNTLLTFADQQQYIEKRKFHETEK